MIALKTFKDADGNVFDVPEDEAQDLLAAAPTARPVQAYRDADGNVFDVPEEDEQDFMAAAPGAEPMRTVRTTAGDFDVAESEREDFLGAYRSDPVFEADRAEGRRRAEAQAQGPGPGNKAVAVGKGIGEGTVAGIKDAAKGAATAMVEDIPSLIWKPLAVVSGGKHTKLGRYAASVADTIDEMAATRTWDDPEVEGWAAMGPQAFRSVVTQLVPALATGGASATVMPGLYGLRRVYEVHDAALRAGVKPDKAAALAAGAGALEGGLEYVSMLWGGGKTAKDAARSMMGTGAKQVLKELLKQATVEAATEFAQEGGGALIDQAAAQRELDASEALQAGAMGAGSAVVGVGLMGGPGSVARNIDARRPSVTTPAEQAGPAARPADANPETAAQAALAGRGRGVAGMETPGAVEGQGRGRAVDNGDGTQTLMFPNAPRVDGTKGTEPAAGAEQALTPAEAALAQGTAGAEAAPEVAPEVAAITPPAVIEQAPVAAPEAVPSPAPYAPAAEILPEQAPVAVPAAEQESIPVAPEAGAEAPAPVAQGAEAAPLPQAPAGQGGAAAAKGFKLAEWLAQEPTAQALAGWTGKRVDTGMDVGVGRVEKLLGKSKKYPDGAVVVVANGQINGRGKKVPGKRDTIDFVLLRDRIRKGQAKLLDDGDAATPPQAANPAEAEAARALGMEPAAVIEQAPVAVPEVLPSPAPYAPGAEILPEQAPVAEGPMRTTTRAAVDQAKQPWQMTQAEWDAASRFYRSGKQKMVELPTGERVIIKREATPKTYLETSKDFLHDVRRRYLDAMRANGKDVPADNEAGGKPQAQAQPETAAARKVEAEKEQERQALLAKAIAAGRNKNYELMDAYREASEKLTAAVKIETAPTGEKTISIPAKDKPGLPLKEQKKWLLTEIDTALKSAPEERVALPERPEAVQAREDLGRIQKGLTEEDADVLMEKYGVARMTDGQKGYTDIEGKKQTGIPPREIPFGERLHRLRDSVEAVLKPQWEMVEFEVPGDGTFKVINARADMENFRNRSAKLFPTTVPKSNLPAARSTAVPAIAKVGKEQKWKGTEPEAVKLLEPFASTDETRLVIMKPHYNAETGELLATDGRRLAVMIVSKGSGKGKKPGWGADMKGGQKYPNYGQVVAGYQAGRMPKADPNNLVLKGVDTEPLLRKLRQGSLVMGEKDSPLVKLVVRENGQIDVAGEGKDVGEYVSGEGVGVTLGNYNPEYAAEAIEFLRRTGSEKITVQASTDHDPILFIGKNAYVVQVPVRIKDGGGNELKPQFEKMTAAPDADAGMPAEMKAGAAPGGGPRGPALTVPDWTLRGAETKAGGSLVEATSRGKVGMRNVIRFMNEAVGADMRFTKSQTSKRHPAKYRPLGNLIFTRDTQSQINYHEAGHGLKELMEVREPGVFAALSAGLLDLTTRAGSMASAENVHEGVAEWVRLKITDPAALEGMPIDRAMTAAVDRVMPKTGAALRDAARAQHRFNQLPVEKRWELFNQDDREPLGLDAAVTALYRMGTKVADGIASGAPVSRLDRKIVRAVIRDRAAAETLAQALAKARGVREQYTAPLKHAYNMVLSIGSEAVNAMTGTGPGRGLRVMGDDGKQRMVLNETWREIVHKVPARRWKQFMQAGWALETLSRYEQDGLEYPGMREGITPADLKNIVKQAKVDMPDFSDRFIDVQRYFDALLDIRDMGGMKKTGEVDKMRRRGLYWPLPRVIGQTGGAGGARGQADVQSGDFRALGSGEAIRDLNEVAETKTRETLTNYYWNQFGLQAVNNLTKIAEMKDLPQTARDLAGRALVRLRMPQSKAAALTREEGQKIVYQYVVEQEAARLGVPVESLMTSLTPDKINLSWDFQDIFRPTRPGDLNVVSLLRKGEREYYQVADDGLFMMFAGRSAKTSPFVAAVDWALGPTLQNWKRNITQSLPFAVSNLLGRDLINQTLMNPGRYGWVPGGVTYLGLVNRFMDKYPQVRQEGILMSRVQRSSVEMLNQVKHNAVWQFLSEGFYTGTSRDPSVRLMQTLFQPSNLLFPVWKIGDLINLVGGRQLSQAGEQWAREGSAVEVLKRGGTDAEAYDAYWRNTGRFNEHSGLPDARKLMGMPGFFNPMLQATRGGLEVLTDPDPAVAGAAWAKLLVEIPAMFALAAVARYLMMDDDDKKKERERPINDRMNYQDIAGFRLGFPNGPDGAMAALTYNAVMDGLLDRPRADAKRTGKMLVKRIADLGTPYQFLGPQISTLIEAGSNWSNFRQQHIVSPWMEGLPASEQYASSTPEFYKKLGRWADYSPMKLQYIVQQAISRQLDETIRLVDSPANVANAQDRADLPFVGRLFVRNPEGFGSASVERLGDIEDRMMLLTRRLDAAGLGWIQTVQPRQVPPQLFGLKMQVDVLMFMRQSAAQLTKYSQLANDARERGDLETEHNMKVAMMRHAQATLAFNPRAVEQIEQALDVIATLAPKK